MQQWIRKQPNDYGPLVNAGQGLFNACSAYLISGFCKLLYIVNRVWEILREKFFINFPRVLDAF